jgi:hypothetical protein
MITGGAHKSLPMTNEWPCRGEGLKRRTRQQWIPRTTHSPIGMFVLLSGMGCGRVTGWGSHTCGAIVDAVISSIGRSEEA